MNQCLSAPLFSRFKFRYCLFAVTLMVLTTAPVSAQTVSATDGATPVGMAAGAPAGTYKLSGFENINYFNGNMNFNLPLLAVGGRGGVGHSIGLKIEQKWRTIRTLSGPATTWPEPVMWGGLQAGYGPGVLIGRLAGASWANCSELVTVNSLLRLTFVASDGTEYELHDTAANGSPGSTTYNNCSVFDATSRGTVFVSDDGNGVTFISDVVLEDGYNGSLEEIYPSGYLKLRDGTQYRINNGLVEWVRDRNGNKITYEYASQQLTRITDSLGRVVNISYGYSQSGPYSDTISYKGFGGAARTIRVWHDAMGTSLRSGYALKTYHDLFPVNGASTSSYFNRTVVTSVELPDGRSYRFKYNSYGELARVELPTGGAFEYDYDGGLSANAPGMYNPGPINHGTEIYRRVVERRVYPDGGAVPQSRMTIGKPEENGVNVGYALVENRDYFGTLLTSEKHFFYGSAKVPFNHQPTDYPPWDQGKEWKTELYDVVNQTPVLRRTVENTWQPLGVASAQLTQTVTTIADSNQVSKQTFAYDQYGNRSETSEFDFGSGTPGALIRRTHIDYVTASTYTAEGGLHLRSLPSRVSVYDSNDNECARITYEYDNYTTSDNYHAALKNWPAITGVAISGLDSSFTSSNPNRGNPTATTRYLLVNNQVSGSITGYAQYDIAGNVVKSIDPRSTPGNIIATTISYDDCFGAPDGDDRIQAAPPELVNQRSYAFPTVVTNALNQKSYAQFDYYVGRPVDGEDVNGIISSGYSDNEPLDRPTKVIRAVNGGTAAKSQTVFSYDDVNHLIITTSDQASFSDGVLKGETRYDGLGRATEQRTYEGGSNYIVVKQEYDAMGRSYKTSNPFRPWQNEVERWTITAFDALGRVTSVTSPDGAVVSTAYNGHTVTVTDQAGKARKSVTDGLGRLTSVYEDPGSLNYQTSYAYDVLDDLTTVTQGSQTRTFVYDSLKRLNSATNPESGAICYGTVTAGQCQANGYDANGNLVYKTDARGVVSVYAYDALNRNTGVTYTNDPANTPGVTRSYDGATNGKGRLWKTETAGTSGSRTTINSFDALGRPTIQSQQFYANGAWSQPYTVQRGYDLAGQVRTQWYPSGHTVNFAYDSAGRTSSFTGNLGEGVQRTYANEFQYTALGAVQQEKFGTDTPLYHKQRFNQRGQLWDMRLSSVPFATDPANGDRGSLVNYYSNNFVPGGSGADNNGNLLRQEINIPGNGFFQDNFAYDALNRLQSVAEKLNGAGNDTYKQAYTFDRWGNRTIDQTNTTANVPHPEYTVNTANNRLVAPAGYTHEYDAAGNQTRDTYTTNSPTAGYRTFDAENHVIAAQKPVSGKVSWAYYTYDGDGQRVRRKIATFEIWQVYGFDGELLAEYPQTGPSVAVAQPQKEYGYRSGQLLVTVEPFANLAWNQPATQTDNLTATTTAAKAVDGDVDGELDEGHTAATNTHANSWWQVDLGSVQTISSLTVWGRTDCCPEMTSDFYVLLSDAPFTSTDLNTTLNQTGVSNYLHSGFSGPDPNSGPTSINVNRTGRYVRVQLAGTGSLALGEVQVWSAASKVEWLVTDHLGTPRMAVDKTGSLAGVSRHDYLPFAEELTAGQGARTSTLGYGAADGVRQKFTSQEHDMETGLDYFGARYYAATMGRFTSVDPVSLTPRRLYDPQRMNLFVHCRNNPLKYLDPDGQDLILANNTALERGRANIDARLRDDERANIEIVGNRVQVKDLRAVNLATATNAYRGLVAVIENHNVTVNYHGLKPGETEQLREPITEKTGQTVTSMSYDSVVKRAGMGAWYKYADGSVVYDVYVPVSNDMTVEGRDGTQIPTPEAISFYHEAVGHPRLSDEDTITYENAVRQDQGVSPQLKPRSGNDHTGVSVRAEPDLIPVNPIVVPNTQPAMRPTRPQ